MRLFAVAAPGLEAVVARECAALPGARDVQAIAGGVEWDSDAAGVLAANLRLRETLAAGLLALAGWDPAREPLVDPMCGSGTIVLEAASIALGRLPARGFACETWPLLAEAGVDIAGLRKAAQASDVAALAHP